MERVRGEKKVQLSEGTESKCGLILSEVEDARVVFDAGVMGDE
ncbi:hypothetical protein ACFL25_00410 [Patescibacteria group bacterium]